jgi:hypothetical protein
MTDEPTEVHAFSGFVPAKRAVEKGFSPEKAPG